MLAQFKIRFKEEQFSDIDSIVATLESESWTVSDRLEYTRDKNIFLITIVFTRTLGK